MIFAGFPTTIILAGIDFVTTAPAPITVFSPISTFPRIIAYAPIFTPFKICGTPLPLEPIVT